MKSYKIKYKGGSYFDYLNPNKYACQYEINNNDNIIIDIQEEIKRYNDAYCYKNSLLYYWLKGNKNAINLSYIRIFNGLSICNFNQDILYWLTWIGFDKNDFKKNNYLNIKKLGEILQNINNKRIAALRYSSLNEISDDDIDSFFENDWHIKKYSELKTKNIDNFFTRIMEKDKFATYLFALIPFNFNGYYLKQKLLDWDKNKKFLNDMINYANDNSPPFNQNYKQFFYNYLENNKDGLKYMTNTQKPDCFTDDEWQFNIKSYLKTIDFLEKYNINVKIDIPKLLRKLINKDLKNIDSEYFSFNDIEQFIDLINFKFDFKMSNFIDKEIIINNQKNIISDILSNLSFGILFLLESLINLNEKIFDKEKIINLIYTLVSWVVLENTGIEIVWNDLIDSVYNNDLIKTIEILKNNPNNIFCEYNGKKYNVLEYFYNNNKKIKKK